MNHHPTPSLLSLALLLCTQLSSCSCGSSGGETPPSDLTYTTNPVIYALGVAIEPNLPTLFGSASSWIATPTLPPGLDLDSQTGVLTGTPSALSAPRAYTIEASNSAGRTEVDLTLAVLEIDPPSGLGYSPANPYDQGLAMSPLPPAVDGLVFEYALDESSAPLPEGLQLDSITGVISGTPRLRGTASVSIVASNPAGHSTALLDLEIAARAVRFVYVANQGDDTLGVFALDSSTGQLTGRGYALTGERPRAVATSPLGTGVYVANFFDGTLSVFFADNASGALSPLQTVAAGVGPRDVAVTPDGRWVYALNGLGGSISRYALDEDTGMLLPSLPNTGLGGPAETMVLDPGGRYLIVTINAALSLVVYRVDPESGALSFVQATPLIAPAADLVFDPSGRYLYVPNGSFNVSGYELDGDSGGLLSIPGSPWSVGAGAPFPSSVVVSSDGLRLYTANSAADNISQFAIDPLHGNLTPLSPLTVAAGSGPRALAMAGQDEYLFVTHTGSVDMHLFELDAEGLASPNASGPVVVTGVDPTAIAVLHGPATLRSRSSFVYTANQGSSDLSGYAADAGEGGTGDLTPITGSPFASGSGPLTVAIHPSNRFLYSADASPGSISLFGIDAATGALAAGTGIGLGVHSDVLLDPSGLYAYGVLPGAPSVIRPYTIDPASGELGAAGSTLNAGNAALYGAVHPTGRFLFVANTSSNEVTAAAIQPASGALSTIGVGSTVGNPQAVALHPGGRWLYAPEKATNTVSQFSIQALSGALSPLTPAAAPNPTPGGDATDAALHPGGHFLYVSNGNNNEVLLFTVDPASGRLSGVGGTPVTGAARGVRVDASGRFLYVSTAANQVVKFVIDPTDGSLSASSTAIAGSSPRGLAATREDL